MGITCGIVGLPNVGKSTLFNALTSAGVTAENYPFATIEPNVGIAVVPDGRLAAIAAIVHPRSIVPTAIEFTDIAGLVSGASTGEGLGNQFLAHIREVDAVAHVVRCFHDPDVVHLGGKVDPIGDIETIATELALADLATVEKALDRLARRARAGDTAAAKAVGVLQRAHAHLGDGKPVRSLTLGPADGVVLAELHLLTLKPTLYVANVDDDATDDDPLAGAVAERAAAEGAEVVVIAAGIEAELADLDGADRDELLGDLGWDEPGLDRVVRAAYRLLGLRTFFTAGEKEVRAWTVHAGATAVDAAGSIHTDFAKGFIRAEVVAYDDFIAFGGEAGAKEAGRWRLEGKDYVVAEGDVVHFRFNV
ncbi:MAG TPA: redox-regulated ATPase YchF [Acidimicrobiia bacterium]|jgi:hypothetical protein